MQRRTLVFVGVVMELLYLSFYVVDESPREVLLFIVVNAISFVLLASLLFRGRIARAEATASAHGHSPKPDSTPVLVIFAFAILFRLTLVFHLPVASDDMYRYVWDGKIASAGINPFALAPSDSSLARFHTEQLPSRINNPTMRTIYPPLAQAFFFTSYALFGDSILGLKLLLIIADIITMVILLRLTSPWSFCVYAWSPLPIMYFALDGHIDSLGILFLVLFIYASTLRRHVVSAVSLGFAASVKLYPLIVAPFLFWVVKGWRRFALPAIPFAMLIIGGWLYWEPTGGLLESLRIFSTRFAFNGPVFSIVYNIVQKNQQAHLICAALLVCWLVCILFVQRSIMEKMFLAFFGFILLSAVVHPWYLTWLAALLALRWSTAVFVLLGLSNLSNIVVFHYRLSGLWKEQPFIMLLEYLPFFVILIWEIATGKFGCQTTDRSL